MIDATTEEARLELAKRHADEDGPGWADHYQPGTFGCHELLDRVSVFGGSFDIDIRRHPACVANPEWYALAEQVGDIMGKLYGAIGQKHMTEVLQDGEKAKGK